MQTSANGVAFIKSHEGFYSKPYWDVDGYSIGYGHHENVKATDTITKEEAEKLLKSDLTKIYEPYVNRYQNSYKFNQNEYDALISFVYNCGSGNLNRLLIYGKRSRDEIRKAILLYNKAGGKIVSGLTQRRKDELKLFNTPCGKTAEYFPAYHGTSKLLDVILKSIGADNYFLSGYVNYKKRTPIATANGIADYKGSAEQNTKLIRLAKMGELKKP